MSLEEALREQEQQVDALLKSAKKYVGTLSAWKKACQTGHLANRQKAAGAAVEMAPDLVDPVRAAAEAWTFDFQEYLRGSEWLIEMAAAAERAGARVQKEDDHLISPPVLVRSNPGRGTLLLGKTAWPQIHPDVVAAELKRLRERASGANLQEFVESLWAVTSRNSQDQQPFAKFVDIYNQFSLAPGWKKENTPAVFAQTIYALHRSDIRTTRAGRPFDFEYPTGKVKDRDIFTVVSEDGRSLRYYGIQFR